MQCNATCLDSMQGVITIRETHFPPSKELKEGERRIYLAVESANLAGRYQSYLVDFNLKVCISDFYPLLMFLPAGVCVDGVAWHDSEAYGFITLTIDAQS